MRANINRNTDKDTLEAGKPYLRSILAFLLYLRYENMHIATAYTTADEFIGQLEIDVSDADPSLSPP